MGRGLVDPSVAWLEQVPLFVRCVLHVGSGTSAVRERLEQRSGAEVYGIEHVPEDAEAAGHLPLPFPGGFFDCILLSQEWVLKGSVGSTLRTLVPLLSTHGLFLLVGSGLSASVIHELERAIGTAGLALYGTIGDLLVVVHPDYNPMTHARQLAQAGRPDSSFEVLSCIPKPYLENPETLASVMAEKVLNVLAMDTQAGPRDRLARFSTALRLFHHGTAAVPRFSVLYQCQADFWRRLGDCNMAARLLRSIQHVAPTQSAQRQLDSLRDPAGYGESGADTPAQSETDCTPPDWSPPSRPPRMLLITYPRPHYGLDVLYDGLCMVLGEPNVVEFPWKPSLHGQPPSEFADYPCIFNRAGKPVRLDELLARLRHGEFDLVLYGDMELDLEQATIHRILEAAGDLPLFVVDCQDDPADNLGGVLEHLGGAHARGYFKREMLACYDYGPSTYPLPFAYPDGRIPADISGERPQAVCWAGARNSGLRCLYVQRIEQLLGCALNSFYRQEDYVKMLRASRIGLSCFGYGFDTVRYWELPAHGCLLLAERPPIRIPQNFRDGSSAVFFNDLDDLEDKLITYLSRPNEVRAIALAGHEHLKRHHTASARAKHLLGWVEKALRV